MGKLRIKLEVGSEAVTQRCSVKKVSLEISQNSQENNFARVSFFIKLQASGLRTPFLKEHLRWLLLLSRHLRKELILGILT